MGLTNELTGERHTSGCLRRPLGLAMALLAVLVSAALALATAHDTPTVGKYCGVDGTITILDYQDTAPKYPGLQGYGHMKFDNIKWGDAAEASRCTEAYTFSTGYIQLPDTHDQHYDDCLYEYFQKVGRYYDNVELDASARKITISYMGGTDASFELCNGTTSALVV